MSRFTEFCARQKRFMNKGFTITSHEGYVHVLYRPNYEITRETMIATCDELEEVCKKEQLRPGFAGGALAQAKNGYHRRIRIRHAPCEGSAGAEDRHAVLQLQNG